MIKVYGLLLDDRYKEFKNFCNSLRCPLCESQLDGNIHRLTARLYCAAANDEYVVTYSDGSEEPEFEQIEYIYPQYCYRIIFDGEKTIVNRYNMDYSLLYRRTSEKEVFKSPGRIQIFRQRLEEKDFLKKLSIYNTFC